MENEALGLVQVIHHVVKIGFWPASCVFLQIHSKSPWLIMVSALKLNSQVLRRSRRNCVKEYWESRQSDLTLVPLLPSGVALDKPLPFSKPQFPLCSSEEVGAGQCF